PESKDFFFPQNTLPLQTHTHTQNSTDTHVREARHPQHCVCHTCTHQSDKISQHRSSETNKSEQLYIKMY
ncbi:hypothetical protein PDJAM_G00218110, partial [Pangasius djambal]|nr:hypothetical protein [Pangasius djambal]